MNNNAKTVIPDRMIMWMQYVLIQKCVRLDVGDVVAKNTSYGLKF